MEEQWAYLGGGFETGVTLWVGSETIYLEAILKWWSEIVGGNGSLWRQF